MSPEILDRVLSRIEYLKPFPLTVMRVLSMISDGEADMSKVAEVIRRDQAISSGVLRLCNSASSGRRWKTTNIQEAVVFLGIKKLREMVTMSGAMGYFMEMNPGYEHREGELWRHVLAVSVLADRLSDRMKITKRDDVFVAALLHDIGKLVLSEIVQETGDAITYIIENEDKSFDDAEKTILGLDHAEVGGKLLVKWGFPPAIVDAVAKHHAPAVDDDTDLVNVVRMADTLSIIMGYETGIDGLAYRGASDVCRKYNLSHYDIEMVMADSLEEINRVEIEYGFPMEGRDGVERPDR